MRYIYKAKDKSGSPVSGEVEAGTPFQAAKLVRARDLIVIKIVSAAESPLAIIEKLRDRITEGDVTAFTRQLATMVNAGLSITESLSILRQQSQGAIQKVIAQILADIEVGSSLSDALSKHPTVFSPTYIALVKSGEIGGVVDIVLTRLSDTMEKQQEFNGKVKGALIYPTIIVLGMVAVAVIMMIFVIPKLTSLYKEFNATLPLPTKILMAISNGVVKFWPIVLGILALVVWGFMLYRKSKSGRRKTDELLFKIPIIGELQRHILLAELARTLSMMVGAGVPILDGLNISAAVMSNVVISEALRDAAKQVEKGFPIAFAFSRHPEAFPFLLSQMVAVGEETGKMEEVLSKVSHIYEVESDQKVKALTAAVEPIIMVFLGVGVGFMVIAIILPIYNLTTSL
jgi:type IV pilus assembly protein PilC